MHRHICLSIVTLIALRSGCRDGTGGPRQHRRAGQCRRDAGILVYLDDASGANVGSGLSDERGDYRLTAPAAGTYRVRTLRIGFRPATSEPIHLAAGQEVTHPIVLASVRVALDTIRVVDRSACRSLGKSGSGAATFTVWEQVRAALTAAQLTANDRLIAATTVGYERVLAAGARRVLNQMSSVHSELVKQPWRALSPETL